MKKISKMAVNQSERLEKLVRLRKIVGQRLLLSQIQKSFQLQSLTTIR